MDGMAGLRIRTRGAQSLYAGPQPGWRGKLATCGPAIDPNSTTVSLTSAGAERLDVLFSCERSGPYNRFQIHSGAATGSPTLQLEVYAADVDGGTTGSPLGSVAVPAAIANTVLEPQLPSPVNLTAGRLYVARYTVTGGTSLQLYCTGNGSSGCLFAPTGWFAVATYADSAGNIKGMGVTTFAAIMTAAEGSKTFATILGSEAGGFADFCTSANSYLRAGFGHTPTEDRMVYAIRVPRTVCKGTPSNANYLSVYIYEARGANWVEVYKSKGKRHTTTAYPMSLYWFIPQGFLLKRGVEYVVAVGPETDGPGNTTDCMQVGKNGQYSLFPRAQNVGQYGGVSEEEQWPAYFSGSGTITFSKTSTGSDLCYCGVQYCYREVPTVILP